MLRIGLVGLGVHGQRYAKHIVEDVPQLHLAAVCRRDARQAQRVAAQWRARSFTDALRLIEDDDVDAVAIVTPPPSHLALAKHALEIGKPVLLEKPLTQTLKEARELESIVAATGTPLHLAQSLRYAESLRVARRELHRIGDIRALSAAQRLPPTDLVWQASESTHPLGSVLNTGVHLYDLVRWMLGAEFESVYCTARRIENPFHEDLFKVQATLRDRPTLVALEIAKCTQERSSNLELVGEKGQLWVDYQTDAVTLLEGKERTMLREPQAGFTIPRVLKDFAQHVSEEIPMSVTVSDGVRTLEVVEACYRSVESQRPEPV